MSEQFGVNPEGESESRDNNLLSYRNCVWNIGKGVRTRIEIPDHTERAVTKMRERFKEIFVGKEEEFEALMRDLGSRTYRDDDELIHVCATALSDFAKQFDPAELARRDRQDVSPDRPLLSKLFQYQLSDKKPDLVRLHLLSSSDLSWAEKYQDMLIAFQELARLLREDEKFKEIKRIRASSWMVLQYPDVFRGLGFHVFEPDGEDKEIGEAHAVMYRNDFIARYGGGETARQGHESPGRLVKQFHLDDDPEKYGRLQSEGRQLLRRVIPLMAQAQTARDAGAIVASALQDVKELFPGDAYGERARQAFIQRIKEKTLFEMGEWLRSSGRADLVSRLEEGLDTADTISSVGMAIDDVLNEFPNKAELLKNSLAAKIKEFEEFLERGF